MDSILGSQCNQIRHQQQTLNKRLTGPSIWKLKMSLTNKGWVRPEMTILIAKCL